MVNYILGGSVVFFALWLLFLRWVRPWRDRCRRSDEVNAWALRSVREIKREFVRRGCASGLASLYPEASIFSAEVVDDAHLLTEQWEQAFALARKSDVDKNSHGPAGHVYYFYDFGLVDLKESLEQKISREEGSPNQQ